MIAQILNVANKSFDYVIIGGGTAGLTVASRLLEHSNKRSVLVLEAGEPNLDDPKVLLGGTFGSTFGDPKYDWGFSTTPQIYSNNRTMGWNRGKGLGGSSCMNFYVWCKPSATDINAIDELGNPGWNWKSFQECTTRIEHFTEASTDQLAELAHTHINAYRGKSGPIKTTVPGTAAPLNKAFLDTLQNMGVPLLKDPYGGNVTGCWQASASLDRDAQWTRSYAATAHYLPNKDSPNLVVLTEATVARILFENKAGSDGNLVANGVEFIYGGQEYRVGVNREVVCSAGTIKSPQVLELSGIGRREVLEKIGVPVKVELSGVGENLTDHTFCGISYELDPSTPHKTFDIFRDVNLAKEQARLQALGEDNMHRYGISAFSYLPIQTINPAASQDIVAGAEQLIAEQIKSGKLPPGLAEQYKIQLRVLKDPTEPDLELIGVNGYMSHRSMPGEGKAHITILAVLQHPFSRGTIHCKTDSPTDQPDIDAHIFENPYDLELFKENVKYVRRMAQTEPLKSLLVREVDPGPENQTDEQIKEYIKNYSYTCFHALGSCSMLPRDKNGVVDSTLKVYGTKNVRVADLSVIPMEISAHTQSAAYYVGEKMAEILLSAY
ncbi:GMC oxidoreductase [Fomitopsis serialis]|uniref:GMC oxidoreductase n=1 Tax=Fomitopsis serialis TaxID=139415 RepID=UPI002007B9AF|nr:GMC oxidoreductase [Neoantrodia serialis]KAH9934323.1 GMC oxidoreductase [Neoantrodia serialis]